MSTLLQRTFICVLLLCSCCISKAYSQNPDPNQSDDAITYIPLPAGMNRSAAFSNDRGIKLALHNHAKAVIAQRIPDDPANAELDFIIVFIDKLGQPILPDPNTAINNAGARITTNELTYTFNSYVQAWSPAELTLLNSFVADIYPMIKNVMGSPFFNSTVNVAKDPGISAAGYYYSSSNEIVLKSASASVFCHESVHAFRGQYIIGLSTYEEGLARATEIEVLNQLSSIYVHPFNPFHNHPDDIYYEALNQPQIGTSDGNILGNSTLVVLKYSISGYLWAKIYLEDRNFFKRFHDSLYDRMAVNVMARHTESVLRAIVQNIKPVMEGLPISQWYDRQHILNTHPAAGYKLYQRIHNYTLDYFHRTSFGGESPIGGVMLNMKVYDCNDNLFYDASKASAGGYGWASFYPSFPAGYYGRVKVVGSVQTPEGLVTDTMYRLHSADPRCIHGVVIGANTGSISITPLDTTGLGKITVPVTNGAFQWTMSLQNLKGRFRVEFTYPDCTRVTRIITKDRGDYFITIKKEPLTQWIGITDNSWHKNSNWSGGIVPNQCTDVLINAGTPFNCVINSEASCRSISIAPGATLTANKNLLIKAQ